VIAAIQVLGPPPSPPTVTLVTPNLGSAAGGWAVTITGTHFTGATGVTIGGVAAMSVVVASSTSITCIAPAYSTPNGTSTGQAVAVTGPGGTGTGSGVSGSYYYLPSNNTIAQFQRADVGVTLGTFGVATWADQSGNGQNWTQSTGSAQPAAPTGNFASTGLPYIGFNGTTQYFTCPAFPTLMTFASWFQVMSLTNALVTQVTGIIGGGTGGASASLYLYTAGGVYIGNNGIGGGSYEIYPTADTNPHIYGVDNANTKLQGNVDASLEVTTVNSVVLNNTGSTGYLGVYNNLTDWTGMNMLANVIYNGQLSTGDYSMVLAVLKATSGTP
jgi:IPT/TIG domain